MDCEGSCVDLSRDPTNCGACGTACAPAERCTSGHCALDCLSPLSVCSGQCVDTHNDPSNCGSCGATCESKLVCDAGVCAPSCSSELATCGQSCKDTTSDDANCGGCDTACRADETCAGGTCQCAAGKTECDGACVDLASDPLHCGGCDGSCASGLVCAGGTCATSCSANLTVCSGGCKDTRLDVANCGACGNACASDHACISGSCACPAGLAECNGRCVDESSDVANCGACGATCKTCVAGRCECPEKGQIVCSGVCLDPSADGQNCGACGVVCPKCVAGSCEGVTVSKIAVGNDFSCALLTDGSVKCWEGDDVERGSAETGIQSRPVPSLGTFGAPVTSLQTFDGGVCAMSQGSPTQVVPLQCWGHWYDLRDLKTPTTVAQATEVRSGGDWLCIRDGGDQIQCIGYAPQYTFATNTFMHAFTPSAVQFSANAWSLGEDHGCYVKDARPYCWGRQYPSDNTGLAPHLIAGPDDVADVFSTNFGECVRETNGDVVCTQASSLSNKEGTFDVVQTTPDDWIACGLRFAGGAASGSVSCWYVDNSFPPTQSDLVKRSVGLPANIVAMALGSDHSCFLDALSQVWCVGRNDKGQLGNGDPSLTASSIGPVKVLW